MAKQAGLKQLTRTPEQPESDGEQMPDDLVRVQLTAEGREGEPKVAKLVRQESLPGDRDAGPPVPPVAKASPVPRLIHQNERAPKGAGVARFKIRCVNLGDQPTRYVLAEDEDSARRHYLRTTGIDALVAAIPEGPNKPRPMLSVRALPD